MNRTIFRKAFRKVRKAQRWRSRCNKLSETAHGLGSLALLVAVNGAVSLSTVLTLMALVQIGLALSTASALQAMGTAAEYGRRRVRRPLRQQRLFLVWAGLESTARRDSWACIRSGLMHALPYVVIYGIFAVAPPKAETIYIALGVLLTGAVVINIIAAQKGRLHKDRADKIASLLDSIKAERKQKRLQEMEAAVAV